MATDLTASIAHPERKDGLKEADDKTAPTTGFWAACLAAALTITFLILTLPFPGDEWAGVEAYADGFETTQVVPLIPVLLLAPVVVVLMACIHALSPHARGVLTHLAVVFSGIYATIIATNYVLQLFVVRVNVVAGDADGLALLAMSNPRSIFVGLEILGYGFFGLMALCASAAFGDAGIERWISRLFVVTGVTGIVGAVSGVADQRLVMLSGFGLSLLAFLAAVVLLAIYLHAPARGNLQAPQRDQDTWVQGESDRQVKSQRTG